MNPGISFNDESNRKFTVDSYLSESGLIKLVGTAKEKRNHSLFVQISDRVLRRFDRTVSESNFTY